MPLGARRLMLIGAACLPVGVVAGRFIFGGLVLASGGTALVAVALSYRAGKGWFSPLCWVVGMAGALWTGLTAGYWWVITVAADASAGMPAIAAPLYYAGTAALIVMLAGTLAAAIQRIARAR